MIPRPVGYSDLVCLILADDAEHPMQLMPKQDLSDTRRVIAFAQATGAPPEALSWLIRLARQADQRRAAGARDVTLVHAPQNAG